MATGQSTTFHWADYVVFAGFLIISAAIGVLYGIKSRRNASVKDFLTGGGQMHFLPVALSMMASFLSAIFILGIPTEFYFYGSTYAYLLLSYIIGHPIAAFFYLPVFHKLRLTSGYEYLQKRFDRKVRIATSMTFSLQMILYMPVVLYAPALAISQVTDLTTEISIISVGLVCTFYTVLGGMRATVWNDAFQMIVVLTGLSLLLALGADSVGGLGAVLDIADQGGRITFGAEEFNPDPTIRTTFWTQVIGASAVGITLYGASQATIQKFVSCRSIRHGQIALLLSALFTGIALLMVTFIGLTMYAYYKDCDPVGNGQVEASDQLIPKMVMDVMGHLHGLPGLFVATTFSASLSTISGGLNALAAVFLEDIIKPAYHFKTKHALSNKAARIISRTIALVLGFGTIGLAFLAPVLGETVIQIALSVFGMIGGPVCGVVTLALFFPCCNAIGALCGLLVSVTLTTWIGMGAILGDIPVPSLPLSTDGCLSVTINGTQTTATPFVTTEQPESPTTTDALWIYQISYLYYGVVAIATCIIVALPISFITGGNKIRDRNLYYSLEENCFCYCPASCMKSCKCDLEEAEDIANPKTLNDLETLPNKTTTDPCYTKMGEREAAELNVASHPKGTHNSAFESSKENIAEHNKDSRNESPSESSYL